MRSGPQPDTLLAMSTKPLCWALFCVSAWAQSTDTTALDAQAAALKGLVKQSPRLNLDKSVFKIQPPGAGWEIGYPSSVVMDDKGTIYVLQRGEKADPVLALNRDGKIIRSWGKGMYKIPHSIRIDPQGNIWTVDSSSSMVLKFTPQGEKLMEISVGEQPAGRGPQTEPPISRSGRMGGFSFPMATATRGSSNIHPRASVSGSGVAPGTVRASSANRTGLRWTIGASSTWRTG